MDIQIEQAKSWFELAKILSTIAGFTIVGTSIFWGSAVINEKGIKAGLFFLIIGIICISSSIGFWYLGKQKLK